MSVQSIPSTQPDDAGAETAQRYHWQALTALSDILATIANSDSDVAIVCEHLADYVFCHENDLTLVSAKHRDPSQGPWTTSSLVKDGGLAVLFSRWHTFPSAIRTRIVTNAGVNSATAGKIVEACKILREDPSAALGDLDAAVRDCGARVLAHLPREGAPEDWWSAENTPSQQFRQVFREFLSSFVLDAERQSRRHLPTAGVSQYMQPVLSKLQRLQCPADAAWKTLGEYCAQRMRGASAENLDTYLEVLPNVLGMTKQEREERGIQARVIAKREILEVLDLVESLQLGGSQFSPELAPTVLNIKLVNGGFGATAASAAQSASSRWRDFVLQMQSAGPLQSEQLASLRTTLLRIASEAEESAMDSAVSAQFGRAMRIQLLERIRTEIPDDVRSGADDETLLGGVYWLASECRVWFSRPFVIGNARLAFPDAIVVNQ